MPSLFNLFGGKRPRAASAARRVLGWLAPALLLSLALSACKAKSEEQILSEAEDQMRANNLLGATLLYQDFLKKYPNSDKAPLARFKLAETYARDKDYEKSRETLDAVIEISGGRDTPGGLNAASLKLDTYVQEQKFDLALKEAVLTSNTLKTVDPNLKAFFQTRVGDLYSFSKNNEKALEIYRGVSTTEGIEPRWRIEALNHALTAYLGTGDAEGLEKFYNEFLDKYPQDPARAQIMLRLGAALSGPFKSPEKGEKYLAKVEEEARAKLANAVGGDEKSLIMFELAQTQLARNKPAEAETLLRKISEEFPTGQYRAQSLWALGQVLVQDGKTAEATSIFQQIIQEYPKTQEANGANALIQRLRMAEANKPTTDTLNPSNAGTSPGLDAAPKSDAAAPAEAAPAAAK